MKIKDFVDTKVVSGLGEAQRIEHLLKRWEALQPTIESIDRKIGGGQLEQVESFERIKNYVEFNHRLELRRTLERGMPGLQDTSDDALSSETVSSDVAESTAAPSQVPRSKSESDSSLLKTARFPDLPADKKVADEKPASSAAKTVTSKVTTKVPPAEMAAAAAAAFEADTIMAIAKESILGGSNDLLSVEYLEGGLYAARSVARIDRFGSPTGSGFLVGQGVAMTNYHVIDSPAMAVGSTFVLDQEDNFRGPPKTPQVYHFDPDRFFLADKELDIALVAVEPKSELGVDLGLFPDVHLDGRKGKALIGHHVNVVHHPAGQNKRVTLRNSELKHLETEGAASHLLYYNADTQKGSSGSPVFNDHWVLIAVHLQSIPRTDENGDIVDRFGNVIDKEHAIRNPDLVDWVANAGVRVSSIVRWVQAATLQPDMETIRDALVEQWRDTRPRPIERRRATIDPEAPKEGEAGVAVDRDGKNITIHINVD